MKACLLQFRGHRTYSLRFPEPFLAMTTKNAVAAELGRFPKSKWCRRRSIRMQCRWHSRERPNPIACLSVSMRLPQQEAWWKRYKAFPITFRRNVAGKVLEFHKQQRRSLEAQHLRPALD